jgi:hypothetical protein
VKFLQMLDALMKFHGENPEWPITLKSLANIRVQALLDLEPQLKRAPIPAVEDLDA